jgi:hypothetical protein
VARFYVIEIFAFPKKENLEARGDKIRRFVYNEILVESTEHLMCE